jgi:hypothetical protein
VTKDLQTDDPLLRHVNDWYRQKSQAFGRETHAFRETRQMGLTLVVSPSSD